MYNDIPDVTDQNLARDLAEDLAVERFEVKEKEGPPVGIPYRRHEEFDIYEEGNMNLEDFDAVVTDGSVIRFKRKWDTASGHLTYVALYAAGRWYLTGAFFGKHVIDTDYLVNNALSRSDVFDVEMATEWVTV